jgi:hypothetical protein
VFAVRSGRQPAAGQVGAFAHAGKSAPDPGRGRNAGVFFAGWGDGRGHVQSQTRPAPVKVEPHLRAAPAMFERIGQALLNDPEDRHLLSCGEFHASPGLAGVDLQTVALHAFNQCLDVAQPRLGRHHAVITDSLDHALGIHQSAAGRPRNGVQGVENGLGLVLAQVPGPIGLGGDDREGMGEDVVQIPGDACPFLLDNQIDLGFLQAALRQFPGPEQTAPFLIQRQHKSDGGAGSRD